jgi:hypothetical protein
MVCTHQFNDGLELQRRLGGIWRGLMDLQAIKLK